ncbi:MAG: major facilitator superfamily 1, partial [Dehalococcoidales bacterium]|nr:major facilitator superfamily 1 [Dehalococcoidales bacterium]
VIFALGVIGISQASNLVMFYACFLVTGLGGAISIHMVPMTVIARWFKKNIGKASGILAMGMAIGGLFAPLLVKGIDAYGWQTLMIYLAVGILILGIPLSFLFRSRPEDYGLLPDGKASGDVKGSSTDDFSVGVREALKMPSFWYIGIASMFQMTALNAVALHQMPYLTSLGMGRPTAALAVTIFSLVGLVARLLFGILADIFPKKYVMALSMGLTTAGLVIFGLIDGSSFSRVVLFAVIYGVGAGGATPLRAPVVREYFGIKHFGAIFGLIAVFTTIGSSMGAPTAGLVFDTRGVYHPVWFVIAGLTTMGTILILMLPPASRKPSPVVS